MMLIRRIPRLVFTLMCALLCYYAIRYINIQVNYEYTPAALSSRNSSRYMQLSGSHMARSFAIKLQCTQVIHIASIQTTPQSCQQFELLLKTIFFHRHHGIHLHIICRPISKKIIKRLLETWDLPHVDWSFIDITQLKVPLTSPASEELLLKALPFLLPEHVVQVIYLSNRMRLLEDVINLWGYFDVFTEYQSFGALTVPKGNKQMQTVSDILLLKVAKIRHDTSDRLEYILRMHKSGKTAPDIFRMVSDVDPYTLPCSWGVSLGQKLDSTCQLSGNINALIWNPQEDVFTGNEIVTAAKEKVLSIINADSALYRYTTISCSSLPKDDRTVDVNERCAEYRYVALIKRRTHLYYVASPQTYEGKHNDSVDITLLTQFTLDRFDTFERFMLNWEGPVHAVLYVTDADAFELPQKVATSKALQNRNNIAYHLVYKRGKFYPINYLRNVAVNETQTPYLLFVDVDLVVNKGLYSMLKHYIEDYMLHRPNVTLVIPAFDALVPLDGFPQDKSELLELMNEKKVIGYRMNRGWNLGHKPTNYPHWVKTNKPYKAIWKDAFEPYTVLATKDAPLYREILLERMGDKIAYGREIYARGYEFLVLPDVFLLHLPHPTSHGTNVWKTYRGYARCGAILFDEYRDILKKQHPDKQF